MSTCSLVRFARDESGVAAIEYALISGLIALVIIGAMALAGSNLSTKFAAATGGFT
jgi:pilus assembly protein Flp/PilA